MSDRRGAEAINGQEPVSEAQTELYPCRTPADANHSRRPTRALASGIFNSGAAIGALLAAPLVAAITVNWGWPRAFLWWAIVIAALLAWSF